MPTARWGLPLDGLQRRSARGSPAGPVGLAAYVPGNRASAQYGGGEGDPAILAHGSRTFPRGTVEAAGIYRINRTWGEVFQRMRQPASGSVGRGTRWMTTKFIEWYWPRLHARAFVLSRAQEYQADRIAAEIAGAPAMASALWRMECLNPWFSERFWPDLYREATHLPEPPEILDRMRSALQSPPTPDDAARWTARGLSRTTGNDDTHPAPCDRVAASGLPVEEMRKGGFPVPVRLSAADLLMGPDLNAIAQYHRQLAKERRRGVARSPSPCGGRRGAARPTTAKRLRSRARPRQPALWESARETADLRGDSRRRIYAQVLIKTPADSGTTVLLGFHLKFGDPNGESLLWRVIEGADPRWVGQAWAFQDHYRATGQTERVREVRARHDRHEADVTSIAARAVKDRTHGQIPAPRIDPTAAGAFTTRPCRAKRLRHRMAGSEKKLLHFPDRPLFESFVPQDQIPRWTFGRADRERELVKRLISGGRTARAGAGDRTGRSLSPPRSQGDGDRRC